MLPVQNTTKVNDSIINLIPGQLHTIQKASDTLQSQAPSSGNWFTNIFSTLWNWVCSLFCCGSKPQTEDYFRSHQSLVSVWKETEKYIREKFTGNEDFITNTHKAAHTHKQVHQGKAQPKYYVVDSDILDLATELKKQGKSPLVLNPANANSVGGGYLSGLNALEEDFFRRSALAAALDSSLGFQKNNFYPILKNETIISDNVPVFRHSRTKNFAFFDQKPIEVSFLTSAAICKPKLTAKNRLSSKDHTSMEWRIYNQLAHACQTGYKTLVLTAFGCGAFGNPPEEIAGLYMSTLKKYFPGVFSEIYFAVIDDHNAKGKAHNPNGNYKPFADAVLKAGGKILKI